MEEKPKQEKLALQKLKLVKASLEHKHHASQTQMAELKITKEVLTKEKKHAGNRLVQLAQKNAQEEERSKQYELVRHKAWIFLFLTKKF